MPDTSDLVCAAIHLPGIGRISILCPMGTKELISVLYDRFNARDMDALLSAMHPDVIWANGMEGGYVYGRDGVRSYWSRQWSAIHPRVDPVGMEEDAAGTITVQVHQLVRDLDGNLLADRVVTHVFQVEDNKIRRFDIAGSENRLLE